MALKFKSRLFPPKIRETTAPINEARIAGPREKAEISWRSSSTANRTPARGALNPAAKPAAAPAAISCRRYSGEVGNHRPISAAIAAPICTVGPCRPKVNPDPTVITVLINLIKATRKSRDIGTPARAAFTWGMPLPDASVAKRSTRNPAIAPPISPIIGNPIQEGRLNEA